MSISYAWQPVDVRRARHVEFTIGNHGNTPRCVRAAAQRCRA
jgi:hypothetical protein